MNPSAGDPDDLVHRKVDLNHVTKMSYQMHVPDSITVGPNRSTMPRLHQDDELLPVRMEVPNSIRLGSSVTTTDVSNGTDFLSSSPSNHSFDSPTQPLSLQPSHLDLPSDDNYSTTETPSHHQHQPIQLAESWHIEPITELGDKHVINKVQLLQNRIQQIERTLARRDLRDRVVYTCVIGYFFLQALLSVRRSMLN